MFEICKNATRLALPSVVLTSRRLEAKRVACYSETMVTVNFASSLQRHKPCPAQQVGAGSLAQVLGEAMQAEPGLDRYVLDDQGHIRKHVAVFVNKDMHLPRHNLTRLVAAGDTVLVIQCLTGG